MMLRQRAEQRSSLRNSEAPPEFWSSRANRRMLHRMLVRIATRNHQHSRAMLSSPAVGANSTGNGRTPESPNASQMAYRLVRAFDSIAASGVPAELWAEQMHGPKSGEFEFGLVDQSQDLQDLIVSKTALMTSSRPSASRLPAKGCPATEPK